jgi:hypothetical protein
MSASHNTPPTSPGYLPAQEFENLFLQSHAFPPHDLYPHDREFGIISRIFTSIGSAFIVAWSYLCGIFTSPPTVARLRADVSFILSEVRALAVMLNYQGELLQRLRTSQLYLFEVIRTINPTPSLGRSAATTPPLCGDATPTYSNIYWTADQVVESVIYLSPSSNSRTVCYI